MVCATIAFRQKAAQLERWDGVVVKPVSQAGLVSGSDLG